MAIHLHTYTYITRHGHTTGLLLDRCIFTTRGQRPRRIDVSTSFCNGTPSTEPQSIPEKTQIDFANYSAAFDSKLNVPVAILAPVMVDMSTSSAVVALSQDGPVMRWGASSYGGDTGKVAKALKSGVKEASSTYSAFAELRQDGSVVATAAPPPAAAPQQDMAMCFKTLHQQHQQRQEADIPVSVRKNILRLIFRLQYSRGEAHHLQGDDRRLRARCT